MSKIAVIGPPIYGHVRPIIPLLNELAGAGFEVHYYNTTRFAWVSRETNSIFVEYDSLLEAEPYVHPCLVFLNREIPHVISRVEGKLLWENYDLVLYDSFCLWGKYLAMLHRLPAAELCCTYPNVQVRDSALSRLIHLEYEEANLEYINRYDLSAYTIDCPASKSMPRNIGFYDLKLLDTTLRSLEFTCPDWITAAKIVEDPAPMNLAFMPEEFMSGPPDKPGARYHFLPSLYRLWASKKKDEEKLIYASFGTRSNKMERLVTAWLKKPSASGIKLRVSAGLEAERLQCFAGENLAIENFIDPHSVLATAGVFITHGGMYSAMEAILTETPMLVVPLTFEQELTARNIHRFQLGMYCPLEKLETTDLQGLVMQLLDDATIRENLKIWRAKLITAGDADRAVALIEQFIEQSI